MNVFEFIFWLGLLLLIAFVSRALGDLFDFTAWIFAIPITLLVFLGFRWLGSLLSGRWRNWQFPFVQKNKDDED